LAKEIIVLTVKEVLELNFDLPFKIFIFVHEKRMHLLKVVSEKYCQCKENALSDQQAS